MTKAENLLAMLFRAFFWVWIQFLVKGFSRPLLRKVINIDKEKQIKKMIKIESNLHMDYETISNCSFFSIAP